MEGLGLYGPCAAVTHRDYSSVARGDPYTVESYSQSRSTTTTYVIVTRAHRLRTRDTHAHAHVKLEIPTWETALKWLEGERERKRGKARTRHKFIRSFVTRPNFRRPVFRKLSIDWSNALTLSRPPYSDNSFPTWPGQMVLIKELYPWWW